MQTQPPPSQPGRYPLSVVETKKGGLWSRLKHKFHSKPHKNDFETLFPALFGRSLNREGVQNNPNPHGSTLVAALPQNPEEQRRLACSLISELDEYERLRRSQSSVYFELPTLRFHVRVVRQVDGTSQQIHSVLSASQLRSKLAQIMHSSPTNQSLSQNFFEVLMRGETTTIQNIRNPVLNVNAFPSYVYDGSNLPSDKNMCVICQSEYEIREEIRLIPCFHFFHKNCIDEWMSRSSHCPICKSKIE